jgi:hypothetical protein
MFQKKDELRYTKHPQRLADVIALISVLSLDKSHFRSEVDLKGALRAGPSSTETWEEIVLYHPEFFRRGADEYLTLVIRSYLPFVANSVTRVPLTITETQKLIDVAVDLHEKEIQWRQKSSHWFPIISAIITGACLLATGLYTAHLTGATNQKIDSLSSEIRTFKKGINSPIQRAITSNSSNGKDPKSRSGTSTNPKTK